MSLEKVIKKIPNDLLLDQVKDWLKQDKKVKIHVVGNSMLPTLKNGDKVLLGPVYKMRLGDIVLATYNKSYVLHRIVGWDKHTFRLVGDGNIGQVEHISKHEIWARVEGVYRDDLAIARTDWKWRIFGISWYVLRPLRAVYIHFKRMKTEFKNEDI